MAPPGGRGKRGKGGKGGRAARRGGGEGRAARREADARAGVGTDGTVYASIEELWEVKAAATAAAAPSAEQEEEEAKAEAGEFYEHGARYWESVDATAQGMLGGFAHISPTDVRGSRRFLEALPGVSFAYALDCGAGIGRVSKGLLCPLFAAVDLVEQNPAYVERAREVLADSDSVRCFFAEGLQTFRPDSDRYSVVWVQWVIGHLPDDACAAFLRRCAEALAPGGYLCLKENNAPRGFVFDEDDGSVTRSDALFREVFRAAGLRLVRAELQDGFPEALFDVRMYALQLDDG